MNQTDFKQIGEILKKLDSAADNSNDQTTLLKSLKNDLRIVNGRLSHIENQIDLLKQEQRETKEELKEVRQTSDALFVDITDVQQQIGGIWDTTKVIDDKVTGQNQRISHLETHVGVLAE